VLRIVTLIFCLLLFSCSKKQEKINIETTKDSTSLVKTEIKVFQTENGWGYDIAVNGKPYIHQPTIPALPGNNGFKTKEEAEKIAGLVCDKIRKNIMPPSVTPEELGSFGIR